MIPTQVPDEAKVRLAPCRLVRMGPPAGVSEENCSTVQMLTAETPMPGFDVPTHFAYFRPTPKDLAILQAGGVLELAQIGRSVQPFALNVCPAGNATSAETEPTG